MAAPGPRTDLNDGWNLLYNPVLTTIKIEDVESDSPIELFLSRPLYAPLLFDNVSSDARDHCANERTFLAWLRLSVYLAVVSVAIFINFHLKHQPTDIERRLSHPLGYIFWILALGSLISGIGNYMKTVTKYARRRAIVQSGVKTQVMSFVVAAAIVAACGIFLGAEASASNERS